MPLKIETYNPNYLPAMIDLFNEQAAVESHIVTLTPEIFNKLVTPKPYFDPKGLFIAIENGQVVGWCHACVAQATEVWMDHNRTHASIEMLVFRPKDLHVGLTLVAEAVNWLRPTGHDQIEAINCPRGYAFYRCLCIGGERLCPASIPHVHLAFSLSGFEVIGSGTLRVGPLDAPPKVLDAAVNLEYRIAPLTMNHESTRQSFVGFEPMVIDALEDGKSIGVTGYVVMPYHAAKLGAPVVNIYMMHVNESHRRKGIGAAMVSRMLVDGYQKGARFTSVGVDMDNMAAQQTYHKFGMLPHTLVFDRRLHLKPKTA